MYIFEVLACSNNFTCISSLIRWRSSSDPALFLGISPSWRVERRLYTSCSKLDYRSSNKHILFTEVQSKNDNDKIVFFTAEYHSIIFTRSSRSTWTLNWTVEDKQRYSVGFWQVWGQHSPTAWAVLHTGEFSSLVLCMPLLSGWPYPASCPSSPLWERHEIFVHPAFSLAVSSTLFFCLWTGRYWPLTRMSLYLWKWW